jgi:hypothetical protein
MELDILVYFFSWCEVKCACGDGFLAEYMRGVHKQSQRSQSERLEARC